MKTTLLWNTSLQMPYMLLLFLQRYDGGDQRSGRAQVCGQVSPEEPEQEGFRQRARRRQPDRVGMDVHVTKVPVEADKRRGRRILQVLSRLGQRNR